MGFIDSKAKAIFRLSARVTKKLADAAWDNREELAKVARAGTGLAVSAGKAVATGAAATGGYLYDHRAEIAEGTVLAGKAAISAGKAAAQLSWDAASAAIFRDSHVAELRDKLRQQGLQYRAAVASGWQGTPAVESLAVGGSLLADIIRTGQTPEDVQEAYELAYPHVAENMTFAEKTARLQGQELVGLVNGVKGKLFEMKYVDYLNSGELPDG